jgi:hypothetical protein
VNAEYSSPSEWGKCSSFVVVMVPATGRDRRGRPLADAVHREDCRLVEGRCEKRRRGMALMVLREQQTPLGVEPAVEPPQLIAQQALLKQFFLEPQR